MGTQIRSYGNPWIQALSYYMAGASAQRLQNEQAEAGMLFKQQQQRTESIGQGISDLGQGVAGGMKRRQEREWQLGDAQTQYENILARDALQQDAKLELLQEKYGYDLSVARERAQRRYDRDAAKSDLVFGRQKGLWDYQQEDRMARANLTAQEKFVDGIEKELHVPFSAISAYADQNGLTTREVIAQLRTKREEEKFQAKRDAFHDRRQAQLLRNNTEPNPTEEDIARMDFLGGEINKGNQKAREGLVTEEQWAPVEAKLRQEQQDIVARAPYSFKEKEEPEWEEILERGEKRFMKWYTNAYAAMDGMEAPPHTPTYAEKRTAVALEAYEIAEYRASQTGKPSDMEDADYLYEDYLRKRRGLGGTGNILPGSEQLRGDETESPQPGMLRSPEQPSEQPTAAQPGGQGGDIGALIRKMALSAGEKSGSPTDWSEHTIRSVQAMARQALMQGEEQGWISETEENFIQEIIQWQK